MIFRSLKWGTAVAGGAILLGGLIFGRDLISYARCGFSSVQEEVRAAIPVDIELERARQMIQEITPQLRSNFRLIVNEEFAVNSLKKEIKEAQENVAVQRHQVAMLRSKLGETQLVSVQVGSKSLPREKVVESLSSRLNRYKQAQAELDSKQKMLEVRERSLSAAQELFDKSRSRKADLEQQVEALAAKHRLIQAKQVAKSTQIDDTQIARANRLIEDLNRRLEMADRFSSFDDDLDAATFDEIINEDDLLQDVDACLGNSDASAESFDFEA